MNLNFAVQDEVLGPSPWYLHHRGWHTAHGDWYWHPVDPNGSLAGICELRDQRHKVRALAGFTCYARLLTPDCVLLWHSVVPTASLIPLPSVQFVSLHLGELPEIENPDGFHQGLTSGQSHLAFEGNAADMWKCATTLSPGMNHVNIPSFLNMADELLVLADGEYPAESNLPRRCIWSIKPKEGIIEVIPQDWFNRGNYDFGYQWITRVWRDESGRLCGDGIRIPAFRLTSDGRDLDTSS
jgi:hypothetical protein